MFPACWNQESNSFIPVVKQNVYIMEEQDEK